MIAYLKGLIIKKDDDFVVLDVNGVGYKVFVSSNSLAKVVLNELLSLEIHTHVKEDSITLYGFISSDELKIFELLLDVSGVGPKTAMNISKSFKVGSIIGAVQKADTSIFTQISGVGKKVAQKIILDLQPKLGKISELSLKTTDSDLVDALTNLGFTKKEALAMSENVDSSLPLSQRIKISLKGTRNRE